MILYLDSSALVKRYIAEPGSVGVERSIGQARAVGTSLISRAEVGAALAKAVRTGALTAQDALACVQIFRSDWFDLIRLPITEIVVAQADMLVWDHGLRGYDAVHLAAALVWQETLGEQVAMATFDRQLWKAAQRAGLNALPGDLPTLLDRWKQEDKK